FRRVLFRSDIEIAFCLVQRVLLANGSGCSFLWGLRGWLWAGFLFCWRRILGRCLLRWGRLRRRRGILCFTRCLRWGGSSRGFRCGARRRRTGLGFLRFGRRWLIVVAYREPTDSC